MCETTVLPSMHPIHYQFKTTAVGNETKQREERRGEYCYRVQGIFERWVERVGDSVIHTLIQTGTIKIPF